MTQPKLVKTRIHGGTWEGVLAADAAPDLHLTQDGREVGRVELSAHPDQPGAWIVRAPIPAQAVGDGIQTFLIAMAGSGDALAQFSIMAGEPVDADLRAEVVLLRAELDLLKRAFRHHCVGSS